MNERQYATIELSQLEQLYKAEHDANMLKTVIAKAYENYDTIDRCTLKILYTMFIGEKEEKE